MTKFEILQEADRQGWRLSLEADGQWILIHKATRAIFKVGYDLHKAEAFLKGTGN